MGDSLVHKTKSFLRRQFSDSHSTATSSPYDERDFNSPSTPPRSGRKSSLSTLRRRSLRPKSTDAKSILSTSIETPPASSNVPTASAATPANSTGDLHRLVRTAKLPSKVPTVILREATPDKVPSVADLSSADSAAAGIRPYPLPTPISRTTSLRPALTRSTSRLSYTGSLNQKHLPAQYDGPTDRPSLDHPPQDEQRPHQTGKTMSRRKIWVRRPGASATLVQISDEDLVDDVRDMIIRKYANSLGRSFDSPDVSLRVLSRHSNSDRILGPEEPISRVIDN